MLPSPGVIFHAICVLTTSIVGMEKLMLQLCVLSAGQSSLHVVLLIQACKINTSKHIELIPPFAEISFPPNVQKWDTWKMENRPKLFAQLALWIRVYRSV